MTSMFRGFSEIFSTARKIVEKNVHLRPKIKRKESRVGGNEGVGCCSTIYLGPMCMLYLIGTHYRCTHAYLPPKYLDQLSEEDEERIGKRLVKKLGLRPDQVRYIIREPRTVMQPRNLESDSDEHAVASVYFAGDHASL